MVNLQYLDTRYALADISNLITHLRSEYGNVPVILHGYDHGAALAVWTRQRYPDLVDGVWASSASLHARKDFGEYLVTIGNSIRKVGGDKCYQDTEQAFKNMATLYDQGNFEALERLFSVCQSITPNDPVVEAQFFSYHALALSEILRFAHSFGVETLCNFLDEYEDPMEGLASFIKLVIPTCATLEGYSQMYMYMDEAWDTGATELGVRQLLYQYCREFGWFRASSYINQPFGNRFHIDLFQEQCAMLFGPRLDGLFNLIEKTFKYLIFHSFNPSTILIMMNNTNRIFGGLTPNVTRVYFTDGDLDPAKTIGVLEPFAEQIYVDLIQS